MLHVEGGGRGTSLDDKGGGGSGRGGGNDTTEEEYRPVSYAVSRAAPLPSPHSSGGENLYEWKGED